MHTSSHNPFRQSFWAIAEYFAYPLMMFAATPLFLGSLGDSQYGQWMFLLTLAGFGGIGGLGMGPAATHAVASARGRNDLVSAVPTVRANLAVSLLCSLIVGLIVFLCGGLFGDKVFQAMGSHREVVLITTFASLMIVVQQIDSVFAGVLRGMERFNLSARIEIIIKFVMFLGALIAAKMTGEVSSVFATTFAISIVGLLFKGWMASQQLNQGVLWPIWSLPDIKNTIHFGGWIWLQGLGSMIFSTADRLLVGSILGASQLAYYSIALQLAQQVQTVPAAGAQVLFPRVAHATEAGENPFKLAINASLLVAGVAFLLALGLWVFGDWLLFHWVGPERAQQVGAILPWLLLAFVLLSLPSGAHFVLMGRGQVKFLALLGLAAGALYFGVAAIGLQHMGFIGAAIGKIVYGSVILLLIPKMLYELRKPTQSQA